MLGRSNCGSALDECPIVESGEKGVAGDEGFDPVPVIRDVVAGAVLAILCFVQFVIFL